MKWAKKTIAKCIINEPVKQSRSAPTTCPTVGESKISCGQIDSWRKILMEQTWEPREKTIGLTISISSIMTTLYSTSISFVLAVGNC